MLYGMELQNFQIGGMRDIKVKIDVIEMNSLENYPIKE